MATAGYLISRAAEQPPILSLTVTIVAVRFFGLARPLARYLDRLVSHDLALRALGRIRVRFYERIEPLAPAQLEGYRRGDLLARMIGDVDALQGLYVRGLGPPVVALVVGALCVGVTAAFLPAAAAILAAGLLVAGVAVPLLAGALAASRRPPPGRRPRRADRRARRAPARRPGARRLRSGGAAPSRASRLLNRELARLGRRDALVAGLGDALSILVTGLTVAGVLAVAVSATDTGALDRVLVATLALLALASFDAVSPLPGAARELSAALAAGRRVLDLTDSEPAVQDPATPLPPPPARAAVALRGRDGALQRMTRARRSPASTSASTRAGGSRSSGRAEPARRRSRTCSCASSIPRRAASRSPAATCASTGRRTFAGNSLWPARKHTSSTRRSGRTSGSLGRQRPTSTSKPCSGARDSASGSLRSRTASTRSSARTERGFRAGSASASRSPAPCWPMPRCSCSTSRPPISTLPTARSLMKDVLDAAGDRTVLLITHRPKGSSDMDEVVTHRRRTSVFDACAVTIIRTGRCPADSVL